MKKFPLFLFDPNNALPTSLVWFKEQPINEEGLTPELIVSAYYARAQNRSLSSWMEEYSVRIIVDEDVIYNLSFEDIKQLYAESGEVKADSGWDKTLMDSHQIKKRYVNAKKVAIDTELEKESPDLIAIARLQREVEKSKYYSQLTWHEKALEGLNERVAKGEADKPVIRQKLQEKIDEARANEPIGVTNNVVEEGKPKDK